MSLLPHFRGTLVWSGVAFALVGYLGAEFLLPSFSVFLLFGGLFLGIGFERNRLTAERSEP